MVRASSNLPHWRTLSIVVVNPFVPLSLDPVNKEPQWPVRFADFGSLIAGNHRRSRRCRRCLLACHFGMCRNRRNSNCCWGARSVRIHVPRHRAVGLGVRIRLPPAESPCPASCTSQNSLNGDPLRACWLGRDHRSRRQDCRALRIPRFNAI
jgi:hypothetical protein